MVTNVCSQSQLDTEEAASTRAYETSLGNILRPCLETKRIE